MISSLSYLGLVLAFLQTHNKDFSRQADKITQSFLDRFGFSEMDYALPCPEMHKDMPRQKRDIIASRNTFFIFFSFTITSLIFYFFYNFIYIFDNSYWIYIITPIWVILLITLGLITSIITHTILMFLFSLTISFLIKDVIGNGDLISGLGILLTIIGLVYDVVEKIQNRKWEVIFNIIILTPVLLFLRKKSKKQSIGN